MAVAKRVVGRVAVRKREAGPKVPPGAILTTEGWEQPAPSERWTYHVAIGPLDLARANALGAEGWELVAVIDRAQVVYAWFKRRVGA